MTRSRPNHRLFTRKTSIRISNDPFGDTSWFDFSKYESVNNLNAFQWRQQIAKRAYIRRCINLGDNSVQLKQKVEELLTYPLQPFPSFHVPTTASSINPLTIGRLQCMADYHKHDNSPLEQAVDDDEMEDIGLDVAPTAHLVIDLNVPKKQLQADFNAWLEDKFSADSFKYDIELDESYFETWVNYAVLEFFDLELSMHCGGARFTLKNKADMFSDYLGETIEETGALATMTQKTARCINFRTVRALFSYIEKYLTDQYKNMRQRRLRSRQLIDAQGHLKLPDDFPTRFPHTLWILLPKQTD